MPTPAKHPHFAKFVSSVDGSLVPRFGTKLFIGATVAKPDRSGDARGQREITWTPDKVEALTHREYRAYQREYTRALRDGSLKERTGEDFELYQELAELDAAASQESPSGEEG